MRRVTRVLGVSGVGLMVVVLAACGDGQPGAAAVAGQPVPAARSAALAGTPAPAPGAKSPAAAPTPAEAGASKKAATAAAKKAAKAPAKAAAGKQVAAATTWKRAFAKGPAGIGCNMSFAKLRASNAAQLTFGRTTVFVGFEQQGQNQDPVFARFDGTSKTYCEHHERQAPDGRGVGFTWDGGNTAYVLYTVVGGGTTFDAKARNGWMNRYGDGGASSKVTVLGQVELRGGTLTRATFLTAKLIKNNQQKTNSIVPVAAPLRTASGTIAVFASSAFSPLNANYTLMCKPFKEYPSSGPGRKDKANYVGIFTADLKGLTCARTWGCTMVRRPCPNVG